MTPLQGLGLLVFVIISCDVTEQKSVTKDNGAGSEDTPPEVPGDVKAEVTQDVTQKLGVGKKVFKTVDLPKHFASYDVLQRDGRVTLEELMKVTGVERKVNGVFKAADTDGDGVLNPDEFSNAPWLLGDVGDVEEETIELPVVLEEIEEDLSSMDKSKKDLYSRPIMERVEEYIEEEKEEEQKVIRELRNRRFHQFTKHDTEIW